MTCYVYVIQAREFVKIGHAENPDARLLQMQTGSPHKLEIIARLCYHTKKAAREYEKDLHSRLKQFHYRGEWFRRECLKQAFASPTYEQSTKKRSAAEGKFCPDGRWEQTPSIAERS